MEQKHPREWLTVQGFLKRFPLARTHVYEKVRDGTIPSVRIGRRILIPTDVLDQMLEAQYEKFES